MKWYVLLFVFCSIHLLGLAQKDTTGKDTLRPTIQAYNAPSTYLRNLSVASPTATALGAYAQVAVDHHTGLPAISIPLTTLKGKQLSLPMNVSYHGGGIQVSAIASWVGLGWSLNAGGVITRQIMGGPDESYFGSKGSIPSADVIVQRYISGYYADYGFSLPPYIYQIDPNSTEKHDRLVSAGAGLIDTEPDIFSYNVNGQAGKFYFDAQRKAHFIPENDFKVEVNFIGNPSFEFDSFTLIDPQGTRYVFGGEAYEVSASAEGNGFGGLRVKSAWYLIRMESMDRQDVFTFSYVKEAQSYSHVRQERYEEVLGRSSIAADIRIPFFGMRTQIQGRRLSKITTAQVEAIFEGTTVREDVSSQFTNYETGSFSTPRRLDAIRVYSLADTSEGKQFLFTYDYYQSVAPPSGTFEGDQVWPINDSEGTDKKRLRLLSVRETSLDGTLQKPPYTCSYETTPLPRRLSLQRDHWGYYNGQLNNRSLVDDAYLSPRPNRSPQWVYMKAGHLQRIDYPTGGWVEYIYEPHYEDQTKTSYQGGLRIYQIKEHFRAGSVVTTTYSYGLIRQPVNVKNYHFNVPLPQQGWRDFVSSDWPVAPSPHPLFNTGCEGAVTPFTLQVYSVGLYHQLEAFIGLHARYEYVKKSQSDGGYATYVYGTIFPKNYFTVYPFTSGELVNYVNNGKLLTESYYNGSDQLQKQVSYQYNILPDYSMPALVTAYHWERMIECRQNSRYTVSKYQYYPIYSRLLGKTERVYGLIGALATERQWGYQYGAFHQQPIREITTTSEGDSLIQIKQYAQDYSLPFPIVGQTHQVPLNADHLWYLQTYNAHVPIETTTYLKKVGETSANGQAIAGQLWGYDYAGAASYSLKPTHLYTLLTPQRVNLVASSASVLGFSYDSLAYEPRASWGYSPTTYELTEEKLTAGASTHYTYQSNGLLASVSHDKDATQALTTTYSHHNYFGVKQITAPNQLSQSFTYTGLGMLATVKDALGWIDQSYAYVYDTLSHVEQTLPLVGNSSLSSQALVQHTYVDGLSRPLQTVVLGGSGLAGLDLVTEAVTYDTVGRRKRSYVPYASSGSGFRLLPAQVSGDTVPYTEVLSYDGSPVGRLVRQAGAGQAWQSANKYQQVEPSGNEASTVTRYRVTTTGFVADGTYEAHRLSRQTVTDEQGNQVVSFHNFSDQLVEQWVEDTTGSWLKTAYVYDELGRLAYVIQPQVHASLPSTVTTTDPLFTQGVFAYVYDERNRPVRQHVPAGGWQQSVYDRLDRLVLTQDAQQALSAQWSFTKYDGVGRLIMQGIAHSDSSHGSLQRQFKTVATPYERWLGATGYSQESFPASVVIGETDTKLWKMYDQYDWKANEWSFQPSDSYSPTEYWDNATGLQTGSWVRSGEDATKVFHTVLHYDKKGRVLQTYEVHARGGSTPWTKPLVTNYLYDYRGRVLKSKHRYQSGTETDRLQEKVYTYDAVGRKTSYVLTLGNYQNKRIATHAYDEVGRLKRKIYLPNDTVQVGGTPEYIYRPPNPHATIDDIASKAVCLLPGTLIDAQMVGKYSASIGTGATGASVTGLQKIDYAWHIRGGLLGINLDELGNAVPTASEGDLFSYRLGYETANQWNGNIGKQTWRSDTTARSYAFTYDKANRLKKAIYTGVGSENYSIPSINYDKNGNITALQRQGKNGDIVYEC